MKAKHIPLRCCIVCRTSLSQNKLVRFYLSENKWHLDKYFLLKDKARFAKPSGRGAWVCSDTSCHTLKRLKRFFKGQAEEIYKLLITLFPKEFNREL